MSKRSREEELRGSHEHVMEAVRSRNVASESAQPSEAIQEQPAEGEWAEDVARLEELLASALPAKTISARGIVIPRSKVMSDSERREQELKWKREREEQREEERREKAAFAASTLDVEQAYELIALPKGERLTDEEIRKAEDQNWDRMWVPRLGQWIIEKNRGRVDLRSSTQPKASSFPPLLDMRHLKETLENEYGKDGYVSAAYSNWAQNGYVWTQADYEDSGFAFCYTRDHFSLRSQATFTVMKLLQKFYTEELTDFCSTSVDILDIGAGPGCAAAGVMNYCRQEEIEMNQVVFVDPGQKWKPALQVYDSLVPSVNFSYPDDMNCT